MQVKRVAQGCLLTYIVVVNDSVVAKLELDAGWFRQGLRAGHVTSWRRLVRLGWLGCVHALSVDQCLLTTRSGGSVMSFNPTKKLSVAYTMTRMSPAVSGDMRFYRMLVAFNKTAEAFPAYQKQKQAPLT